MCGGSGRSGSVSEGALSSECLRALRNARCGLAFVPDEAMGMVLTDLSEEFSSLVDLFDPWSVQSISGGLGRRRLITIARGAAIRLKGVFPAWCNSFNTYMINCSHEYEP